MSEWWDSLSTIQQVYWGFAIPFSFIFLIQMVLTFVGGDMDADSLGDAHVELDHDAGFQFFTIKNFIGFFTLFAWTGIACLESGFSSGMTLLISFLAGVGMMILMAAIFYYFSKLADSGTLSIDNAIGGVGEVYLPIHASRGNIGRVQIKVQGSLRELEAITDDTQELSTGTVVSVVDVINKSTLVVTKSKN